MKAARIENTSELTLRIWERLQLIVGEPGQEGVYNCRISDIDQDCLMITRPVFAYGNSLLADNRPVTVHFTRSDAAYMFRARLTETEPKSSDTMYLKDLGRIDRLQRRQFVRVEKVIPVSYIVLPRPIVQALDLQRLAQKATATMTINVSAGGLLMEADEEVDVGGLLLLDFRHSDLVDIPRFVISVCRRVRLSQMKERLVGVEFIFCDHLSHYLKTDELSCIPPEARQFTYQVQNSLVSRLFSEQLRLRQKGLL